MTEPTRYSTTPVQLSPHPVTDPAPVDGCAGCTELSAVRDRARTVGDMTTVSDCNVLLRRHPQGH
ncbi:hypothetical protein [Streptomyces anulatus]|uniref:hypothetical protein n=1 Tax=Streptomyces anulatus TaxID=1892 RepID=UPI002E378772|nr:hypothetical protein [Streptomyces anulatus]WTD27818.1 hypothetical protein OH737_26360 [Streptomyces anulatus]